MQGIKRLQYYGLLKALMPASRVKIDRHDLEGIKSKNRLAKRIRFRWYQGAYKALRAGEVLLIRSERRWPSLWPGLHRGAASACNSEISEARR